MLCANNLKIFKLFVEELSADDAYAEKHLINKILEQDFTKNNVCISDVNGDFGPLASYNL
jgi:hypothetical protein